MVIVGAYLGFARLWIGGPLAGLAIIAAPMALGGIIGMLVNGPKGAVVGAYLLALLCILGGLAFGLLRWLTFYL